MSGEATLVEWDARGCRCRTAFASPSTARTDPPADRLRQRGLEYCAGGLSIHLRISDRCRSVSPTAGLGGIARRRLRSSPRSRWGVMSSSVQMTRPLGWWRIHVPTTLPFHQARRPVASARVAARKGPRPSRAQSESASGSQVLNQRTSTRPPRCMASIAEMRSQRKRTVRSLGMPGYKVDQAIGSACGVVPNMGAIVPSTSRNQTGRSDGAPAYEDGPWSRRRWAAAMRSSVLRFADSRSTHGVPSRVLSGQQAASRPRTPRECHANSL